MPVGLWDDSKKIAHIDFIYPASCNYFAGSERDRSAMIRSENLIFHGHSYMNVVKNASAPPHPWFTWNTYLVAAEWEDKLFMVRGYLNNLNKRVTYRVYHINNYVLDHCKSLNDLVMLIGVNHSFTVKHPNNPSSYLIPFISVGYSIIRMNSLIYMFTKLSLIPSVLR